MATKFTKLRIGEVVASFGGRVWKRLCAASAENEEVQDELKGTWVINPSGWTVLDGDFSARHFYMGNGGYFYVLIAKKGVIVKKDLRKIALGGNQQQPLTTFRWSFATYDLSENFPEDLKYETHARKYDSYEKLQCSTNKGWVNVDDWNNKDGELLRTVHIGDIEYEDDSLVLLEWLKANATKQASPVLAAGLYNEHDNLIASWDTLVNTYGMDCERDYTLENYETAPTSPYYVLTKNTDLKSGRKLIIGNGITSIGNTAFCGCSSLKSISIPDSVEFIDDYAFCGCSSLKSISIPDSVRVIGYAAFSFCTSLEYITIPDNVTQMMWDVFKNCTNLKTIYCETTSKPSEWSSDWLRYCDAEVIWGYTGG